MTLKTSLVIDYNSNIAAGVKRDVRGMQAASGRMRASLRGVHKTATLTSNALGGLANRWTALAGGVGLGLQVKSLIDLERQFTALGIQAGKSDAQIRGLKKEIEDVAGQDNIKLGTNELLSGINAIIERTGDFDLARDNIENIGLAVRATGSTGADIGALISNLSTKFSINGKDNILGALDLLINQGKSGSFVLSALATQSEKVTAAYSALGRGGLEGVREMGSLLQVIRSGTGGNEQAVTAFEAFLRTLSDETKIKALQAQGIKIRDEAGNFRSAVDIYKDTIMAANGDIVKLSSIFDSEAQRALNPAVIDFNKTGGFKIIDQFYDVLDDGTAIQEDATRAAETLGANLTALDETFRQFADKNLAGPVKALTEALNDLDPETVKEYFDYMKTGLVSIAGVYAMAKGIQVLGAGVKGVQYFKNRKIMANAPSLNGGSTLGLQRVFVVNMPRTLGGAGRNHVLGGSNKKGFRPSLKGLKLPGAVGAALTLSSLASTGLPQNFEQGGAVAGNLSGALAGGMAGAAIGSVIPIIGTAVGGVLGSVAGAYGGEHLFSGLGKWLDGQKTETSVKMEFINTPAGLQLAEATTKGPATTDITLNTGPQFGGIAPHHAF